MKTNLFILIRTLSVAMLMVSCAFSGYAQRITVSGSISGEKKDSVWICFNSTRNEWKGFAVDNNNHFSFSFSPKKFYNFVMVENDEILLQSGDSVFISLQGDSLVDISGGNATLNKSLLELQQWQSELWKSSREDSLIEFVSKLNQWYNRHLEQIDACQYANGNADRDIALSYLNFEAAAVCYAYLTRITGKDDTLKYAEAMNSNEFRRFIEMKDVNDTVVGQTIPYCSALEFYLYFKMNIDYDQNKSYMQNLWGHIMALNLPKPNNDVAYCLISLNLLPIGYTDYDHFFQDTDSLLHYFDKNANEKENAEYLRNEFERKYEYLRPGRQIKDVVLTDTLGNKYLLSDFKDKIIYVKMWSLGCKGCIQEISEYNELLSTFSDTNVVFISVARDREQYTDKWKAAIRSYDLKGLNFISENGLNLGFHGLPKYYIIGKNNTIVTLKAPHPRSLRLKPMLEELIKEESKNE